MEETMERGRRKRRRGGKRRRKQQDGDGGSSSASPSRLLPRKTKSRTDERQQPPTPSKRRKFDSRPTASCPRSSPSNSTTFLDKMKARLKGGHFRMINEKLYTCSGNEALDYFKKDPALFKVALDYFKKDPALFKVYHSGYQEQMSHWPEQPINIITKWLTDHSPALIVADFGCGDAHLSRSLKNKVFSIDLVASDPSVIACDMSSTPLDSSSVDVAIFCLSLMGVNYPHYLQEANRVLKPWEVFVASPYRWGLPVGRFLSAHHIPPTDMIILRIGWLLIAEVRSRLDPNNGGADPEKFVKAVQGLGFISVTKDFSNKMFVLFYFKKKEGQNRAKNVEWPQLKPCLYKRR